MGKALIAGVGMGAFSKPGAQQPYPVMASAAIRAALVDAGVDLADVQRGFAGYCYGGTTCGQRSLYEIGRTGIPVVNVRNACATGSTALMLAREAVMAGSADVALAFGFEEMKPGALVSEDFRVSPVDLIVDRFNELDYGVDANFPTPGFFGAAGAEYLKCYGADPEIFAQVAVKTRRHAANNPLALFRKPLTVEEVMAAPLLYGDYLTRLMACPPTCGAAAAIVVSERFARERGIGRLVEMAGQAMGTDSDASFDNAMNLVGRDITRRTANAAYEEAGIGPDEAQVVELHDCFTTNEVISYEGLGLCGEGEASRFIADGDNSYGGRVVVNPSGGLMSKGHPLGATGLAQATELVQQVRGEAGARQVEGATVAIQHNIGMGSAGVVTVHRRY